LNGAQVVFSGSGTPGEGEHKVTDYLRRCREAGLTTDPPAAHCLYGSDADLVMLGLATRERRVVVLREADSRREWLLGAQPGNPQWLPAPSSSVEDHLYVTSGEAGPSDIGCYELFNVATLMDYLAIEYADVRVGGEPVCVDHVIDDTVLLTILVGNDFLPGLPGFTITEEGLDTIVEVSWGVPFRKK
jgi:5'-3' exonuclease